VVTAHFFFVRICQAGIFDHSPLTNESHYFKELAMRTCAFLFILAIVLPLPLAAQEIRPTATLTGYRHYNVAAMAFSPDSRTLAVGTPQGVQLWDVEKNEERAILKPPSPQESWQALAFSPDGKLLAGAGQDAIPLWDVATKQHRADFANSGRGLAWTPDGKFLVAVGGRAEMRVWDIEKQKLLVEYATNEYYAESVAIAPSGKDLVIGTSRGFVFLADARSGKGGPRSLPLPHWRIDGLQTAVSPRCQRYASIDKEGTLTIGGIETTQIQKSVTAHKGTALALAFSADGLTLASGGGADRSVKLWDAITLEHLITLTGHTDRIAGLAFSPDGRMLASGSFDKTVKLWDVAKVLKKRVP
jgi:WD40 repeat protein